MRTDTKTYKAMKYMVDNGYQITDDGIVLKPDGKTINTSQTNSGYLFFVLHTQDKPQKRLGSVCVHQFQAFKKYGESAYQRAECVRHMDGNKTNNSADNIRLGTHRQNQQDRGLPARKEAATKMVETKRRVPDYVWEQVSTMRGEGMSHKEIADVLGMGLKQISSGLKYRQRVSEAGGCVSNARYFTEGQIEQVLKKYDNGETIEEIASNIGMGYMRAYHLIRRHRGNLNTGKAFTDKEKSEILELYDNGKTVGEVASNTGREYNQVYGALRRWRGNGLNTGKFLTESQEDEILARRDNGESIRSIAESLGKTPKQTTNLLYYWRKKRKRKG